MPKFEPLEEEFAASLPEREVERGSDDSNLEEVNDHFSDESREQRMEIAMMDVLDGVAARGRNLKYWENLKLRPRHVQMLLMKAAGYTNKAISRRMQLTESRVSVIVNHPDAMFLLSHLVSFQAEKLLDVKARIQSHAGEALDTALLLMRTAKEEVRERSAFKILGMAGYGVIQKSEAVHKFEMPASQAMALTTALRESADLDEIPEAEWERIESRGAGEPEEEGLGQADESGNLLDASAEDLDVPPIEGLPVSTPLARRTA